MRKRVVGAASGGGSAAAPRWLDVERHAEVEDYTVELEGVTTLELHIVPDIARGSTPASLSEWTLA